ncbi:MAG: hypothetical protein M1825_001370 [Sarcosagium campestre]|nr:MAG: hypothetical protein M1825_001370 [Sarcosagium campestre]
MTQGEEVFHRPFYVYDLPQDVLASLQCEEASLDIEQSEFQTQPTLGVPEHEDSRGDEPSPETKTSCSLCGLNFDNVQDQRSHARSDLHGYNLKQRIRGLKPVSESEFEKLIDGLEDSISGSDSSDSENDGDDSATTKSVTKGKDTTLTALLKKQATLSQHADDPDLLASKTPKRGSGRPPLVWFKSKAYPSNTSLGIYRALFTEDELRDEKSTVEAVRQKQLPPTAPLKASAHPDDATTSSPDSKNPHIFLCMIGGGHFAAMIVSLAPRAGKQALGIERRQASVLAHKTFHRYTTRRKQGGSQSANDAAKGAAHSAGSSLRRYNETALTEEVRRLLQDWKAMIDSSALLIIRATSNTNRRTLFGPYDGQVLRSNDPRIRSFPFSTRRATQAELMRAFIEVTRVKITQVDEAALAAAAASQAAREASKASAQRPAKATPPAPTRSKEEEAAHRHTSQLQTMIKRGKAPATVSYLSSNSLSPDFQFVPHDTHQNHHASTPLHLAASSNTAAVVLALLTKAKSDPTVLNGEGKAAFDIAGDRPTRDAFRIARHELGEDRWNWNASHIPAGLSKQEADKRQERDRKEAEKVESERRKVEMERLRKEEAERPPAPPQQIKGGGQRLGAAPLTGAEKREAAARGMTPEMRMKLERERRARAAEDRIRRMQGGQ